MSEKLPSISVVMPTYNAERTLQRCLSSILGQDYPREKIEIIIVDGGSNDDTLEIAKKLGVDKILENPLMIEEAGKPLAIDMASNELIAFIDSDNLLPSPDWIKRMVKPFEDPEIIGSEPLYYEYRKTDDLITRYCSLIGADDSLYPYLRIYDRFCHFKGRWTEAPMLVIEDKKDYFKIRLNKVEIPTMGANGFFVKKEVLRKIKYRPLHIHTDTVYRLVESGYDCLAKVKFGIVHLHSSNIDIYVKKKLRRIRKYYLWKNSREYYPKLNRSGLLKFILSTTLVFPLALDVVKGYRKIHDNAWLFHFIACFLTLYTYGLGALESKFLLYPKVKNDRRINR